VDGAELEDLRLVDRRPHPSDRRAKQLHLTSDGAKRREKLLVLLRDVDLLTGLNEQERDTLKTLLERATNRR
jgi:DNA-binding MarR family transcriptional regulator